MRILVPDTLDPDDRDLEASINDFEAAVSAKRLELVPPTLETILVALDGSNQDAMTLGLAADLACRGPAKIHLIFAYPGRAEPSRDAYLDGRLRALVDSGIDAVAVPRGDEGVRPYEQIANAASRLDVDLLIVPAPYLEDFDELGSDSIGTTLDKLMVQARPLLVVRQSRGDPTQSLRRVLLPLTVHVEENPVAAAWALRLVADEGIIRVIAVVEERVLDTASDLLGEHAAGELDREHLAGLDRPESAGLIASLHREAQARGLGCRVSVREGDVVHRVSELATQEHMLIVTGCDTDPSSISYRSVQAIIRSASDPVLVV